MFRIYQLVVLVGSSSRPKQYFPDPVIDHCEQLCRYDGVYVCTRLSKTIEPPPDHHKVCEHYFVDRYSLLGRCYDTAYYPECALGVPLPLAMAIEVLTHTPTDPRTGMPAGGETTPARMRSHAVAEVNPKPSLLARLFHRRRQSSSGSLGIAIPSPFSDGSDLE